MADINSYALGLELQLQTKPAFEALTKIEQKLQNLEKKMATVGAASIGKPEVFEQEAKAIGLDAMARYELERSVNSVMKAMQSLEDFQEEVANGSAHLTMTLAEQMEKQDKLVGKLNEERNLLRELSKRHKEMSKEEKDMLDLGVDMLKQGDETTEQYKQIKEQTESYSKVIKKLSPLLNMVGVSEAEVATIMEGFTRGMGLAAAAVVLLAKGFREVLKMQEAYAKTTFRALGSQLQLIQQTNALRSTLGATSDEAIQTMGALAQAGFRASDSLSELADANFMFSKSTGVSAETTADYQRRLTTMGLSAEQATASLGKMSAMIRNSGLSAQQAQGILQGLNKTLMRLNFALGSKQAKETGEAIAKMGAAAQAAGGDASGLAASLGALATDGAELQRIMGAAGLAYDENASKASNLQKLMKGAAGGFKDLGIQGDYVTKILADMGFEDVALNSDLMNKKAKELGMTFDQYVSSLDQGADLTEDFNNAMATFKDSLHRILAPLLTLGAQLMDIVGPALVALMKPLVLIAQAIGSVVSWLNKIPGVSTLIAGLLIAKFVPSLFKGITAFLGFGKSINTVMKAVTGLSGVVKGTGVLGQIGSIVKGLFSVGGAAKGVTGAIGSVAGAAGAAGEGLAGMGGGAIQAAMGLARAHPVIAAVVAAVAGAFLIVPKLFEMFNTGNAATSALAAGLMALLWPLTSLYVTLRTLWAIAKGVWEAISDLANEAFKPLTDALKQWLAPGEKSISLMDVFNKGMDKLTKVTKVFMKAFTPVVWLFKMLGGIVGWVVDGIKKAIDKFGPVIKFAEWAINKISKFLGLEDEASEQVEEAAADNRDAWEKMYGTYTQLGNSILRQQELMKEAGDITGQRMAAEQKLAFEQSALYLKNSMGEQAEQAAEVMREKIASAIGGISGVTGTPAGLRAEPVVSPNITDKTARNKAEEHNEKMLAASVTMNDILGKLLGITIKSDTKADVNDVIELLKNWLPKIAEEKSGGLSTAANQWL